MYRRAGLLQIHLTRTPRLLTIFGCLVAPKGSRLLSWPPRMKEDKRKDRLQERMHKAAAPVISCGPLAGTLGTRRYSRRHNRIQLLDHQQSFASLSLGVSKLMLLLSLAACPAATRISGADSAHVLLLPSSQRLSRGCIDTSSTYASSATVTRMRVRTSFEVVRGSVVGRVLVMAGRDSLTTSVARLQSGRHKYFVGGGDRCAQDVSEGCEQHNSF